MFRFLFGDTRDSSNRDPFGRDGLYGGHNCEDGGVDAIFRHFQSDMQQNMEEIHQQMEDLIRNFGVVEFSNSPAVEFPTPDASGSSRGDQNLRDAMLKTPDSSHQIPLEPPAVNTPYSRREDSSSFGAFGLPKLSPFFNHTDEPKVDRDLDGRATDVLKDLENPRCSECPVHGDMPSNSLFSAQSDMPSNSFFSGQSVTVRSVTGPDGKMEQWRTVENSLGHKEETCTRFIDGKMHTVTRKIDGQGNEEKIEEFKNMDDSDLPAFNKTWYNQPEHPADTMIAPMPRQDSYLGSIFSKLFGFKP